MYLVSLRNLLSIRSVRTFINRTISIIMEPPTLVKGMKILNKDLFSRTVDVSVLYINDNKNINNLTKYLQKYLLKLNNFKPIKPCPIKENVSIVYFKPGIDKLSDFNEEDMKILTENGYDDNNFGVETITLVYDNWKADEILKAILPDNCEVSSYSIIGHIVHVNLRDELIDYGKIIGQVLMDKIKNTKCVVSKSNNINNEYRTFEIDLLCGKKNYVTKVKENGKIFMLDFSKVYWNPRLSTEHERIIKKIKYNDIFYDVFAGIGPFSIPIACCGAVVLANDLNPESVKWLKENIKINKKSKNIQVFNKDAHDFIRTDIKRHLIKSVELMNSPKGIGKIYIAMNLPALAVKFVNSFKNLFTEDEFNKFFNKLPKITLFVYCFAKGAEDKKLLAKELIKTETNLSTLDKDIEEIKFVRNVAPNKDMMRISLLLTRRLILGESNDQLGNIQQKGIIPNFLPSTFEEK